MSSYYGVANGRNIGVYDNWEDCKKQVHRYSNCDFKKFDTPDKACDYVDQQSSSRGDRFVNSPSSSRAIAYRNGNQVAARDNNNEEIRSYHRTDYMQGRYGVITRERTVTSGQNANGSFVEKYSRTSMKKY